MALARIKAKLHESKIYPTDGRCKSFMPETSLRKMLNIHDVTQALWDSNFDIPPHKRNDTAETVIREGWKVFAILLELNCEKDLVAFIENDSLDSSLPLDQTILIHIAPDSATKFERLQWEYLPHSFRRSQYHRRLRDAVILPYIRQDEIARGGFSSVYRVLVHSEHQDVVQGTKSESVCLVRKELQPYRQDPKAEAELLFLLGSLRNPNIVELLASYTQHGISSLLFLPADCDLHEFLLYSERPESFKEDFVYFHAMRGLSSGLAHLHNFSPRPDPLGDATEIFMHGYHHDIKPRNILIRGTNFILADFGLSRLKKLDEDTKTPWKDTTFEYGAPECRDPESFIPGVVGRAIDIWSLGCIFSEIAVYMENGTHGVSRFRTQRVIEAEYGKTRCFHDGESLSSNVIEVLDGIEENCLLRSMRSLISLIRRMFSRDAKDRPRANQVEKDLFHMALEALLDELIETIQQSYEFKDGLTGQNLFRTRLLLEKNRLLSWAGSLGLKPVGIRGKNPGREVDILASPFYCILRSAFDALNSGQHFERLADNCDFTLNVLRHANDDLCKHLSEETRSSIDNTFHIITASRSGTQSLHQIATLHDDDGEEDISATAAMKLMSLMLEKQAKEPSQGCRVEASLMRRDSSKVDLTVRPERWFYSYGHQADQEREVIVEFVPYWKRKIPDSGSQKFQYAVEAMFGRVQELVSMLKRAAQTPGFRVLDCLGTFHDPSHRCFGLVYTFPAQQSLPVRLNKLLRHGKSHEIYPDLVERLELAKSLVACVQRFHTSGWLHKNISSLNILFFTESTSNWCSVDLREPYVVGFDHSRRDDKGQWSQGPILSEGSQEYLHPDYRNGSTEAKRSHDYYSLGLVLLEIGLWSSLSNLYDRYPTYSPSKLRDEYIHRCDKDLGKTMGPTYQGVTKACLVFRFTPDNLREQLDFQTDVADRLNACKF